MRHFFLLIAVASSLTACATAPSSPGDESAEGAYVTGSNIPRRAKKAPTDRVQTYDGSTPAPIRID